MSEKTASESASTRAIDVLEAAIPAKCEPEIGILEPAIANVYADAMRDLGIDVELWEVEPGRPSVVGHVKGTGGGKSLIFNAHLCSPITEFNDWQSDPYKLDVRGGKIYGSGVADARGGIVAMIAAAGELVKTPTAGDLYLGFGAGGEYGGQIGTKAIIEKKGITIDGAIVCEATHLNTVYRERGALFIRVDVTGVTGLSGGGVNANHAALDLAIALRSLDPGIVAATKDAPSDVGPGALNINLMNGGTFYYNVPDRCVLFVDRRLGLYETPGPALEAIEVVIDQVRKQHPKATIESKLEATMPSCITNSQSALANAVSSSIQSVTGMTPTVGGFRGFTEMAHFGVAGLDAVVCGPGDVDVIHRPNEHIDTDEFNKAIDVYYQTALDFTSQMRDIESMSE